jgi:diguanylate cyclase (GGDEF)-like protein
VAFAVPFNSVGGTRVFSGAFDARATPLAHYLKRAAVLAPNRAYLTDASGVVFATNDPAIADGSALPEEWMPADEQTGDDLITGHLPSGDYVVSGAVEGTPWRLVMKGDSSYLYETVGGFSRLVPWLLLFGFVAGGLLSVFLVERLARRRERLAELNAQLALLVNVDMLTGLPNRRSVDHELDQTLAMAKRYGHPLSVLMIDVDSFKTINDTFGHAAGDSALRHVATLILKTLRDVDIPGRWAGDEFLAVLPHVDADGAQVVAGRLNMAVANAPLSINGEPTEITLSIGIAQWQGEEAKDLIHRADEALYVAKAAGRDRFFTSVMA